MSAPLALPPLSKDLEEARSHLAELGCARIESALPDALLGEARSRLEAQARAEREHRLASYDGLPAGTDADHITQPTRAGPNQWVWNLINKGEIFRRIVMLPLTETLMHSLLGDGFLLSSFTAHIAGSGGACQTLHRDSGMAPDTTPYPIVANIMWLLDDFTDENGATRIVPGSHRFPTRPPRPASIETVAAEGPAGSAFVFDGRLWHGTGANRTAEVRRGLLSYHCRGWVRQQENFTLSLAPDVLERCSDALKRRLGFSVYHTLGAVRSATPALEAEVVQRPTAFVTELS